MTEAGTAMTPEMENLKTKLRATWMAGDFGKIAQSYVEGSEEFINRLNLKAGGSVLDVACGTGNLAIPAARTGATVTGVDIAPNLVEQARMRAAAEKLDCKFDEGDAEQLQYEDGSFDVVVTMFGAMFAPRPERAAAELIRVCRSGGRIAMANWTPTGFTGQMFKINASHVPPPANMSSPVLWGDEESVRGRLQDGISDLQLTRRLITFRFPFSPDEVVEHFASYFGPTQKALAMLDADGQAALLNDLKKLWAENNRADDGTTEVISEYLEIVATKA